MTGDALRRTIWDEVHAERERAHQMHGANSMESWSPFNLNRLTILLEEIGEVAREFNEAAIAGEVIDTVNMRTELIQVAAMAGAWADALSEVPGDC